MPSLLQQWACAVKDRDGKCVDCGATEDLHAHHIKPKATHPELKLEVGNGKTLCYRCHKREHDNNKPKSATPRRPHRRVLEKRIQELEREVQTLRAKLKGMELAAASDGIGNPAAVAASVAALSMMCQARLL